MREVVGSRAELRDSDLNSGGRLYIELHLSPLLLLWRMLVLLVGLGWSFESERGVEGTITADSINGW